MALGLINKLDLFRRSLNGNSCRIERSKIGQFLTPALIAQFMASLFKQKRENVRILDAGAGAGVLFAACVESLISCKQPPHSINVVAYENDERLIPYLQETMDLCETACEKEKITFNGEIRAKDFVESGVELINEGLFSEQIEKYTHAILNPPYKKINGQSETRKLLDIAGMEVSNLYAAFVWIAMQMLESDGEIVAITPRSFCNGPYFRRFRVALLELMSLQHIHVFESRKKAFGDDNVLQENVIFHAVRRVQKPDSVVVSSSEDANFNNIDIRRVPYSHVVMPRDSDAFIHLVLNEEHDRVMERMGRFKTSLDELDLEISTGRVVDFRSRDDLRPQPVDGAAPLIYPCHFHNGFMNWPSDSGKKPNAIVLSEKTKHLLVVAGYYVLTKRFTAKEERRRVVAAIYDPQRIKSPLIGFENHLNYFHSKSKGLSQNLAKGLALYLNSSLFDQYFRIFSGHTQVNATDLRKMRYPSRDQLTQLGTHVKQRFPDTETVDALLRKECEVNE